MSQRIAAVVLSLILGTAVGPTYSNAQNAQNTQNEEMVRRAKTRVQPTYPELAHKMNISGTVKIEVTVAPPVRIECQIRIDVGVGGNLAAEGT